MDRLLPSHESDIDAYDAYRPADPRAPLVRINMVASVDGRIADGDGVSGGLGGAGDQQVFFALRNMADAIVAGAGTVRAEGYGPMRPRPGHADQRRTDGLDGPVPIVVVTRSMDLDTGSALFTAAVAPTVVLTTVDAPSEAVGAVRDAGGIVVQVGRRDVDLASGIAILGRKHGLHHLLIEGGPRLNGHLLAAGLADELCLTIAPQLVGGGDARRVVDGLDVPHDLRLTRALVHDGELLLTYGRR
ncbi:pyrimidine reductase family protein [soil metagenome]